MTKERLLSIISDQDTTVNSRLEALKELDKPHISDKCEYVNNHIHTSFSFSPYTPTSAVYYAALAGLSTAGIMDHDSVGGCEEFIDAGKVLGMPVTVGFECRTSVKGTPLEGLRLNNPDQKSVAYVTLHGIPHDMLGKCAEILAPLRAKRNERNIKMCAKISEICGVELDFDNDVLPLSQYRNGGSVTERHVLYALAKKLVSDDREASVKRVEDLTVPMSDKTRQKLLDAPDDFFTYDVLGILKSHLVEKIYIDADEELMHITDFTKLAQEVGGICAYAYLGDVTESPTGDKKAQKFEDDYLDELFINLKEFGFNAVTYMPSRNTKDQLERIISLCNEHGFFQISGEDINSPRQSFTCPAMADYPDLFDSTYALIGHEIAATADISNGMFTEKTINKMPTLDERTAFYAEIGRKEGLYDKRN